MPAAQDLEGRWVFWKGDGRWWRLPELRTFMPGGGARSSLGYTAMPENHRIFIPEKRVQAVIAKGYMGSQAQMPFLGEIVAICIYPFSKETLELIWWDL